MRQLVCYIKKSVTTKSFVHEMEVGGKACSDTKVMVRDKSNIDV